MQKVTNEIWLKISYTCHAPNSLTSSPKPNMLRTSEHAILPTDAYCVALNDLFLFVWLHPWNVPEPYEVWFSSSKCRRTSSQREGWMLALRAGEAEIKDAWSSTYPTEDDQHGSIFSLKLQAYVDALHTTYRITNASCKREHRCSVLARQNTHQATGPLFSRTALRSAHLFFFF